MTARRSEGTIAIGSVLGIAQVAAVRELCVTALEAPGAIRVDISALERVDSAGVQLLLSLAQSAAVADRPLLFEGHSAALLEETEALGLAGELDLPAPGAPAAQND